MSIDDDRLIFMEEEFREMLNGTWQGLTEAETEKAYLEFNERMKNEDI